jgi:hypothetical protein
VPIRTYSGWSLRSAPGRTTAARAAARASRSRHQGGARASGDPRLSIEERYSNFFDYYYKVTQA